MDLGYNKIMSIEVIDVDVILQEYNTIKILFGIV